MFVADLRLLCVGSEGNIYDSGFHGTYIYYIGGFACIYSIYAVFFWVVFILQNAQKTGGLPVLYWLK